MWSDVVSRQTNCLLCLSGFDGRESGTSLNAFVTSYCAIIQSSRPFISSPLDGNCSSGVLGLLRAFPCFHPG